MKKIVFAAVVLAAPLTASYLLRAQAPPPMGFFITSAGPGKGADLGGLKGADKRCQPLAAAAGGGGRVWHAYLSTAPRAHAAVNARDRIGTGPWTTRRASGRAERRRPARGEQQAGKEKSLTEKGDVVNGRGDTPNRHDILTGSQLDGTASRAART